MKNIKPLNTSLIIISVLLVLLLGLNFFDYSNIDIYRSSKLATASSNNYHPFSEHPQYNLVMDLQKSFIQNAKIIGPSVVNISEVHEQKVNNANNKKKFRDQSFWYSGLKLWFYKQFGDKKYISKTIGSGIIINKTGYILTNYHVIENKNKILIRLSDESYYFAKLIGIDPLTDLAVLKINSFRSFPHPPFNSSNNAMVGQWVMAIGNPYGLQGSVTVGVISGIGRSDLGIATYENFIQTDASINPGNSGGPLINLEGEVIGINTSIIAAGSGIGFAIPIKIAMEIVDKIIESGSVERGWLGVGIQRMTPELATLFKIPINKNGVLINSIENHAPAKIGGMRQGDVVIKYDGKETPNSKIFRHMVADTIVGKKVPIIIIRDGQEKLLQITIGKLKS